MNKQITTQDTPIQTMTSTELADLLGMEKKEINRKIKEMFPVEIAGGKISPTLRANKQVDDYHLPELESTMFVGRWHTPFLKQLAQFWIDRKNSEPVLPPKTYSKIELLEMQLEAEKETERLSLELRKSEADRLRLAESQLTDRLEMCRISSEVIQRIPLHAWNGTEKLELAEGIAKHVSSLTGSRCSAYRVNKVLVSLGLGFRDEKGKCMPTANAMDALIGEPAYNEYPLWNWSVLRHIDPFIERCAK